MSVSPAVWGFAGGLAAIGLRGLIDVGLEERRLRREAQAAARVLVDEITAALIYIDMCREDGCYRKPHDDLALPAWNEHRALLARRIRDERDWHQLQLAIDSIRMIHRRAESAGGRELIQGESAYLEDEEKVIRGRGFDRLLVLARGASLPARLWMRTRWKIRGVQAAPLRRMGREEDAIRKLVP